ncbi:hypothetical protein I3760_01G104100 [Carya illinoinensis]|nr:hypothetical protein I3760_01G104100 [Carya illinoinensis]
MASLLLLLSQIVRPQTTAQSLFTRIPFSSTSSSSSSASYVAATIGLKTKQPALRHEAARDNKDSEEMEMENLQEFRVCVESVWP